MITRKYIRTVTEEPKSISNHGLATGAAEKKFGVAHTIFQKHFDDHKINCNRQFFHSNIRKCAV
jgi:hypothetical protein